MSEENFVNVQPRSQSELIRTAFLEIGIGFIAVVVVIAVQCVRKGMWQLFAQPFTLEFFDQVGAIALVILLGAMFLAFRDYRAGMKKLRAWEHRQAWGRDQD